MMLKKDIENFVICGWKARMGKFIEEVLKNNHPLKARNITILANVNSDMTELFRQEHTDFEDITIIRGVQYNETLLRKIRIGEACKALVLADESNPDSSVGVDSLTVLTAMTIRSISINIPIIAELIDIKFEKYLKAASVDEIIYTSEYSDALLANSLQQIGLTKAINDLLVKHQTGILTTVPVPNHLAGANFKDVKDYFLKTEKSLAIGLLENVGNLLERKKEAIRTAQKTASIKSLIDNLKVAKSIENNRSHLLPDEEYIVPDNSMAILITKNISAAFSDRQL